MELSLWIDFFQELQHVRGRSINTVKAYQRDLELFFSYYSKEKSIVGFYQFMNEQKLSSRSQARIISCIRSYYRFCERRGIKSPELGQLRLPKVKTSLPSVLKPAEFEKLFLACEVENPYKTIRNQLTLLFLFGLGCRVSELIGLDLFDFNATARWVKVLGKGNRERLIPLSGRMAEELSRYLKEARPVLAAEGDNSILVNDRGHRPSRVDIWRWLAAWSSIAGFPTPLNPHRFRHGFATSLLENGADLRSLQLLLGHSSIQTTQIYTSVSAELLEKTIENFHPLGKLEPEEEAKVHLALENTK